MIVAWMSQLPRHAIDARGLSWLTHTGSLTKRLRAQFPDFRVRVVRQCKAQPNPDERQLLGLQAHQLAWLREVVLYSGEVPLIVAHSVLPLENVRGAWNLFAGLGARPLGEVLFTDPTISRGDLSFNALRGDHPLHRMVQQALPSATSAEPLWARRSLFHRKHRSLLVSEVFLPDLLTPTT